MRIAHLTDLHLRRRIPGTAVLPPRRSREAADLFVQALADARDRGADLVVLTGDLLDVPGHLFEPEREVASDAATWLAVREDYRWLREQLDQCGLPWVVVPGNHDSMAVMRQEFGDRPMVTDVAGVRVVSFWDREHAGHVPQRVLAERRRFESSIIDPDPTPQVHLQHYVITPELNQGYPHTYLEGEELRRRMAESQRVALSLSGHYHRGADPEQYGGTWFSVTPALTEAPHPYRLFDLDLSTPGLPAITWQQVNLVPEPIPSPAVFLDRDGCINTLPAYDSGPSAMELIPGAAAAIRRLREAGFRVVVVTNQSCVGLGYVTPAILAEVNDRMHELLAREGAHVDAIYASYEAGERAITAQYAGSSTHKPSPAMLQSAAQTLTIDLAASWMVGDRPSDISAGRAAGAAPILVRTGQGTHTERTWAELGDCPVTDDLAAAADLIVRQVAG